MKFMGVSLIAVLILTSCSVFHCPNKETFIKSYQDFAAQVELHNKEGKKDWTAIDKEFKDYANRCYQDFKEEMTLEEKKEFWASTLKYYVYRFDGDLEAAYDDARMHLSDAFNEDLKQLKNEAQNDIGRVIKELFKDDIKKGVDQILDALNEIGDEVKRAVEEDK